MKKVLITGARGLIGSRLKTLLLSDGYGVNILSRSVQTINRNEGVGFEWDVKSGKLDERAFQGVSAVIHLAGAGVADKRWTKDRKREIVDSRVKSAKLIFNFLKKNNHEVKTFISASAVGYYGDCAEHILSEDKKPGKGFLAETCVKWEEGAKQFTKLGIREVRCRIGIVLSENGGALPELTRTIPFGVASYFAKSNLYYPWIHIDDVCGILKHVLENEGVKGPVNTTGPSPLLMKDLMQEILRAKHSSALLVPTPPIAIKLGLGEMSEMVLSSQRCSSDKILESGYKFKFGRANKALRQIFTR